MKSDPWVTALLRVISTDTNMSTHLYPESNTGIEDGGGDDCDEMSSSEGAVGQKAAQWSRILPTVLIPIVVPIPRYLAWCRLTQNYWADEDPVLRYIPYFGDDDITGFDTSYYDYVPGELEGELGGEVLETAITVLTDLCTEKPSEQQQDVPSCMQEEGGRGGFTEEEEDIEPLPTNVEMCFMSAFGLSVAQVRQVSAGVGGIRLSKWVLYIYRIDT